MAPPAKADSGPSHDPEHGSESSSPNTATDLRSELLGSDDGNAEKKLFIQNAGSTRLSLQQGISGCHFQNINTVHHK